MKYGSKELSLRIRVHVHVILVWQSCLSSNKQQSTGYGK